MGLCEALQNAHSSMCLGQIILSCSSPSRKYVLTELLLLKSRCLFLNGLLGRVKHTGFELCIQDLNFDLISLEFACQSF